MQQYNLFIRFGTKLKFYSYSMVKLPPNQYETFIDIRTYSMGYTAVSAVHSQLLGRCISIGYHFFSLIKADIANQIK